MLGGTKSARLWNSDGSLAHNVKALLSVAEIEKQKLNYAEKFI
jgi:hypothetical protein